MAMKNATKAALCSAFIFPGMGLVLLKHYKRAAIFIISAIAALWYLCSSLYQSIEPVYTNMLRDAEEGTLVVDLSNMDNLYMQFHQEIEQSLAAHHSQLQFAQAILIAAWACSIISSYFVGKQLDLKNDKTNH